MSDKVDESEEKVTTSDYVTAIGDGSVNLCSSEFSLWKALSSTSRNRV